MWFDRKRFTSNFYIYCATFWVENNGNGYNQKSFIFDLNINNFDIKCPFRALSLNVEISAWFLSDSTEHFRSGTYLFILFLKTHAVMQNKLNFFTLSCYNSTFPGIKFIFRDIKNFVLMSLNIVQSSYLAVATLKLQ